MSKPIKETPVLYGKDAKRFLREVAKNEKRDHRAEFERVIKLPASTEKKLRQSGYYKRTPKQRSKRIKAAFRRMDEMLRGIVPSKTLALMENIR